MVYFFKSLNHNNALKLTASIYNSRSHSSLYSFSPLRAHFDSHASSIIVRKTLKQFNQRQRKIYNIFNIKPEKTLQIGDRVLIKRRRHTFHKANPLFYPQFEDEPSVVTEVNKLFLPWTYKLQAHPNKWFYFFELRRISPSFGVTEQMDDHQQKIFVEDFIFQDSPFLRSKKNLPHKQTLYYIIQRGGQSEKVTRETLEFFKRIFGKNVLNYSEKFQKDENRHFKV